MARRFLLISPLMLTACPEQTVKAFNAEPEAEITSHADGSEVLEGFAATFRGAVSDPDHSAEDLTATWYLDGAVLCESAAPDGDGISTCEAIIPEGAAQLVLEVQDPMNAAGSDQIMLSVLPTEAPEAQITTPTADGVYYSDLLITFEGWVSDEEDAATDLVATWESTLDGELKVESAPNSDGTVTGFGYLSEGEHALQLNVTDTTGKTGSDSVIIQVGPPNSAPSCQITAPEDGASGQAMETVVFEATVADVDVSPEWLTVSWTSDKDGELGQSTPDSTGAVAFAHSDLSSETHTITLMVTDEMGATCSDFILYTVGTPPEISVLAPLTGDGVNEGEPVSFSATVGDNEDSPEDLMLSWVSDLDGAFSTQGSDGSGAVDFTVDDLSIGTHTVTVTVTDTDGFIDDEMLTLFVNGLPTAPVVALTPDPATTSDDLVANILTDSTDPDGDPITYAYAWSVDGVSSTASTSDTLPASATEKGQTWTVTVTPNDGKTDGPSGSDDQSIGNTPPVLSEVTLSPDPAYEADTLTCTPGTTTDADGTVGFYYSYGWSVNGADIGETADTLDGSSFDSGDEVQCWVTPNDGDDDGDPVASNVVSIDNHVPDAPTVSIVPNEPLEGEDDLLCQVDTESFDEDGDIVSYTMTWAVDGVAYTGAGTTVWPGDTVPAVDTFADEVWTCTVTPNDGEEDGPTATASVTVGSSTCFEPWTDTVTSLTESAYEFIGEAADDVAGQAVANAGDVDGDGLDDLLIGAIGNSDGGYYAGKAYLFLGASLTDTASLDLSEADYAFIGEGDNHWAGYSVSSAGDVDGDGLDDVLIGALYSDEAGLMAGEVYLFLGASLGSSSTIDLGDADFRFIGEDTGDCLGHSLTEAGDVDGDGLDDILLGAIYNDDGSTVAPGKAYLFFGSSLTSPGLIDLADADYSFQGENDNDFVGSSLDSAGDVDGDGLDDLLFGAHFNDDGASGGGKVYLMLASSLGSDREIDLADADHSFVAEGVEDYAGWSVSGVGDVDGDGFSDLVIGAYNNDDGGTNAGKAYLILGAGLGGGVTTSLADADVHFVGEASQDFAGYSVTTAGDVDEDGLADFWISAPGRDGDGSTNGRVYLILASSLGSHSTIDLSDADYAFMGSGTGDSAGMYIAGGGDVDGNGLPDLLIGASSNGDGGSRAGKAQLVLTPSICNTPPRGTVVSIDPSAPVEGEDDLVCSVVSEAYDAEGDAITYSVEWEVDGVSYTDATTTSETGDTVPAADTFADEEWTCWVTTSDGTDSGGIAQAMVTIEAACHEGSGSGEDCPGESCLQILDDGYDVGDGDYWLDPDGTGAVEAYCDMTTDGGGWTRIFRANSTSIYEPTGMDYTLDYQVLRDDADEVLMAFMDETDDSYTGSTAQFDIPSDWVSQAPFRYSGTSASIDVSIDGGATSTQTLRYGYSNIGAFDTCASISFPQSGSPFGLLCITATPAAYYGGWAETVGDYCTESDTSLDTGRCVGSSMLGILVR